MKVNSVYLKELYTNYHTNQRLIFDVNAEGLIYNYKYETQSKLITIFFTDTYTVRINVFPVRKQLFIYVTVTTIWK